MPKTSLRPIRDRRIGLITYENCLILSETDRQDQALPRSDPFQDIQTLQSPLGLVRSFLRQTDMTVTSETCLVLFETYEQYQTLPRPLLSSSKGHDISSHIRFSPKRQGVSNPLRPSLKALSASSLLGSSSKVQATSRFTAAHSVLPNPFKRTETSTNYMNINN